VRFRAPATILLRRAQITLMLATLVPTVLMTAAGIVLLALGSGSVAVVTGVLVLAFCTTSVTGYILGSIFVSRGASMARVQNDFLSLVSHELRTPLTSIRLFIESLRDERLTDPAEKRQCLDLLKQETERLDELVTRLLDLSRIEAGRHAFVREPVAVADLVREALTAFDAATLTRKVEVDVELEPALMVAGDRLALARAITNLLVNAWKHTPEQDRRISLAARASGARHVEIIVADNGPGIPRGEQREIFEQFQRGRGAIDDRVHGVGLGLAFVRAIIAAHRGRVELRSRAGEGSEFRIRLRRLTPAVPTRTGAS
jgi:two-component system phosphate regulon sensor histidine kinase PhoR